MLCSFPSALQCIQRFNMKSDFLSWEIMCLELKVSNPCILFAAVFYRSPNQSTLSSYKRFPHFYAILFSEIQVYHLWEISISILLRFRCETIFACPVEDLVEEKTTVCAGTTTKIDRMFCRPLENFVPWKPMDIWSSDYKMFICEYCCGYRKRTMNEIIMFSTCQSFSKRK